MKTFKTKKGKESLGKIIIMQDLSPREGTENVKLHKRQCGLSKAIEEEEYQQRKEMRTSWNNIASRPSTKNS